MSDDKFIINAAWKDWCVFQCIAPMGVLLLMWPLGWFYAQSPHPFQEAYATGDLLVFGALLLLGVTVELRRLQLSEPLLKQNVHLDNGQRFGMILAAALLIVFGAVKVDIMRGSYFGTNEALPYRVTQYAYVNLALLFLSVTYCMKTFWKSRVEWIAIKS